MDGWLAFHLLQAKLTGFSKALSAQTKYLLMGRSGTSELRKNPNGAHPNIVQITVPKYFCGDVDLTFGETPAA